MPAPRRARGPGRGRAGRHHPRRASRRAATSATCRSSATTPPATTPAGRRSRPRPWASSSGRRPGRLPLQPGHGRRRRHDGRLRRRPPVDRARRPRSSPPSTPSSATSEVSLPPRRAVPPHRGRARRRGSTPSASRPTTSPASPRCGPPARRRRKLQALMDASPRRSSAALRRSTPTRSGCGARARSPRCRRSSDTLRPRRAGLVSAVDLVRGPRRAHRHPPSPTSTGITGWYDTNYEGKRDAVPAGAGRRRRPVPHPRRGQRRGRPRRRRRRRRSRPSRTGTGASSAPSSRASTPSARGGCCSCPTTPRRSRCGPTRPTRCPTCSSTPPSTARAASTPKRDRHRIATRARPPAHEPAGRTRRAPARPLTLRPGPGRPRVSSAHSHEDPRPDRRRALPARRPGRHRTTCPTASPAPSGRRRPVGRRREAGRRTSPSTSGWACRSCGATACDAALQAGLRRASAPTLVVDLSDEPVVDARQRMGLAARTLVAGVAVPGRRLPLRPAAPAPGRHQAVGRGHRHRQAHRQDGGVGAQLARLLAERGTPPVVVAMGRGGPPEPELVDPADVRPVRRPACWPWPRPAATPPPTTWRTRWWRAWPPSAPGGAAGGWRARRSTAPSPPGWPLANGRPERLLVFEGSGASIPPVHADATICVMPATVDPELVTGYLGAYRLLLSDLIVVTMVEPSFADLGAGAPTGTGSRARVLGSSRKASGSWYLGSGSSTPCFGPFPSNRFPVAGSSTSPLRRLLPARCWWTISNEQHGCTVVGVSHHLARPARVGGRPGGGARSRRPAGRVEGGGGRPRREDGARAGNGDHVLRQPSCIHRR